MLSHFIPEKTSPLLFIAIAVTLAIIIQRMLQLPAHMLHTLLFSSLLLFGFKQNFANQPYKNIFFLSAIFAFMLCVTEYQQKNHLTIHEQLTGKKISIHGTVVDIQTHNHTRLSTYIQIEIDEYKTYKTDWLPLQSSIVVYTKNIPDVHVSDYICVENIISNRAQGSFKDYLEYQNIGAYFFCPYFHYTLLERPSLSITRHIHKIKTRLISSLEEKLSPQTFCLFSTLFLGKKMKHIDPEQTFPDHFRQWGISHLLARSGAHLALFIYLYFLLLMLIPLPLPIKQFFCASVCIIYFLLTFSSTSFLRAFITILLFFYCSLIKRPTQSLHLTLAVYIIFLLFRPITLFFLDFQLSFLFTISLSWLGRKIYMIK